MTNNFLLRFLSALIIGPLIILIIYFGGNYFNLFLIFLSILGLFEILMVKNKKVSLLIFLIFILFLYSCYQLRSLPNGDSHLFLIIIITWLSDTGGYIFGKFFGGKKINFISPNKTYAGFIGSIILSFTSFFYINFANLKFFESIILNFTFIIIASILVILGDLLFSYFKRESNIKDFSNFIPGHGGLFDRIDGMIVLTIIYYLFN